MPYSKSVDVWSFGILAYELACGKLPFEATKCKNSKQGQWDKILNDPIADID